MTRYLPARHYLWFAIAALALAGFSTWRALAWAPNSWPGMVLAFLPAVLFVLTASLLLVLAFRPPIEVHEGYLSIGRRAIPWMDIRRLDRTGWVSPLVVRSEEHTSELQSLRHLVCRLLLEKKKKTQVLAKTAVSLSTLLGPEEQPTPS